MKLCERSMDLWTMFNKTLSDEGTTKIKVIDLDEYYNFYVHEFLSSIRLVTQNFVWSCYLLKFKISTV